MGKGELVCGLLTLRIFGGQFSLPPADLYFQEEMPGDTLLPSGMRKVAKKPRKQHYTFLPKQSEIFFWGGESTEVEISTGRAFEIQTESRAYTQREFRLWNLRILRVFFKFDGGFIFFEIVKKTEQLRELRVPPQMRRTQKIIFLRFLLFLTKILVTG